MKFADGPNKLRIMSAPIFGHEYWTKDKKPALHQRGLFLWVLRAIQVSIRKVAIVPARLTASCA
jgi:hypothetical protein